MNILTPRREGRTRLSEARRLTAMVTRAAASFGLNTVHHALTVNAKRFPNRIALIQDGARLAYETLDKQANQIANALITRGLKPGDHVGILAGNTISHVLALYAVSKAAGISVVFDVKWVAPRDGTSDRSFSMLPEIVDRAHSAQLPPGVEAGLRLGVLYCDHKNPEACEIAQACQSYPDRDPTRPVAGNDIFMFMLTSGTTASRKDA